MEMNSVGLGVLLSGFGLGGFAAGAACGVLVCRRVLRGALGPAAGVPELPLGVVFAEEVLEEDDATAARGVHEVESEGGPNAEGLKLEEVDRPPELRSGTRSVAAGAPRAELRIPPPPPPSRPTAAAAECDELERTTVRRSPFASASPSAEESAAKTQLLELDEATRLFLAESR